MGLFVALDFILYSLTCFLTTNEGPVMKYLIHHGHSYSQEIQLMKIIKYCSKSNKIITCLTLPSSMNPT